MVVVDENAVKRKQQNKIWRDDRTDTLWRFLPQIVINDDTKKKKVFFYL